MTTHAPGEETNKWFLNNNLVVSKVTSIATGVTLYREGKRRTLVFKDASITSGAIGTLPATSDYPTDESWAYGGAYSSGVINVSIGVFTTGAIVARTLATTWAGTPTATLLRGEIVWYVA